MSDNVESNSNVIDANNFLAGSGFRYICELKEDSMRNNVPNRFIEDWMVIESWLVRRNTYSFAANPSRSPLI